MDKPNKYWKLKLRLGLLTSPYRHYSIIAEGIAGEMAEAYDCPKGNAYMGLKVWATSTDEASEMIQVIAAQIGFNIQGHINVYTSEPTEPPQKYPFGYGINFHSF